MLSGFFAQTHSQHKGCSWVLCQTGDRGGGVVRGGDDAAPQDGRGGHSGL